MPGRTSLVAFPTARRTLAWPYAEPCGQTQLFTDYRSAAPCRFLMSSHSPVGTFHLVPGSVPTGVRSPGVYIQAMWFEVSMLEAGTRAEAPL